MTLGRVEPMRASEEGRSEPCTAWRCCFLPVVCLCEKKTPRDAAAWLRPSLARALSCSLSLLLSPSLPLQTLDLNLLRIQHRGRRQAAGAAAEAAASPAAAAQRDTAASRCTTPPAGLSSPPRPPCSSSQVPGRWGSWGGGVCCAGGAELPEQERRGRKESPRGQEGV